MSTIGCMYSCALCGVLKETVEVPIRKTEDVVEWMNRILLPALVKDHERRSPGCKPTKFTEVTIPLTGRDIVGGPINN